MNITRLTILAHRLERVRPRKGGKQFNMSQWYQRNECGTSACAIGYACTIPAFKKDGFVLIPSPFHNQTKDNEVLFPSYDGWYQWDAVQRFFGVSLDQADYLFSSSYYDSNVKPKDVAERIREFINEHC